MEDTHNINEKYVEQLSARLTDDEKQQQKQSQQKAKKLEKAAAVLLGATSTVGGVVIGSTAANRAADLIKQNNKNAEAQVQPGEPTNTPPIISSEGQAPTQTLTPTEINQGQSEEIKR